MTKEANTGKFLSADQLQDINGGCQPCDRLVEAYNGFNQQGDHLHAMANKIRQANTSAQSITNGGRAAWHSLTEQALREKASQNYLHASTVKGTITKIGHFAIK